MKIPDTNSPPPPNTNEVENNVVHAEPHDVRLARRIIAAPKRDPLAEDNVDRILAAAVIRYYEKR